MRFDRLSDHELLNELATLMGSHREVTAKLVAHLAEVEERRLHLVAGFTSMFEFCVKHLRMSEGEAFRRLLAARLGGQFPIIYALLGSGAIHLSALQLLANVLTDENHEELFEAASGKTSQRKRNAKRPSFEVFEKVRIALQQMGFRPAQAQRAVAAVEAKHCDHTEPPAIEDVMREALWVATA